MIEDVMHGIVTSAWLDEGRAGWDRFKVAVYAPPGNIQRSLHLDSRRAGEVVDPKGKNLFLYPGEPPAGAPHPGWH